MLFLIHMFYNISSFCESYLLEPSSKSNILRARHNGRMLGEKNWWLPRWLDRILPTLNVEGDTHLIDDAQEASELVEAAQ